MRLPLSIASLTLTEFLLYPIPEQALTACDHGVTSPKGNACQIGPSTVNDDVFDDVHAGERFPAGVREERLPVCPVSYAPARRTTLFREPRGYGLGSHPAAGHLIVRLGPAPKRCRGIRREADAPVRSCAEREGFTPFPAASPSACLRPILGFPRNPCPQWWTAIARSSFSFDPPALV